MSIDATRLGEAVARETALRAQRRAAARWPTWLERLLPACLAACLWWGSIAVARAESPPDLSLEAYRAQIARARAIVDAAEQALQTPDGGNDPGRMAGALPPSAREELRRLLPERCVVTTPTSPVAVNNQALRSALNELGDSTDAWDLRERLRALDARLGIIERHLGASPSGDAADIQAILAREAFQPIRKTKTPFQLLQEWIADILGKILDRLPSSAKAGDDGGVWSQRWAQAGLWIALAGGLMGGSLWIVRRYRRQEAAAEAGARVILGEAVALDMDADELLAQARRAAEAGDWRQAARKVYIALLHDLDKRAIVPLNPAWTNREYLAAVRAQTRLYPPLRDLTERFDVLWYGQQSGSQEDYERFLARYQEARAALAATA